MISAIETKYHGYKFRSRLEARWAVFFDHMLIEFQYEPEGFELTSGWYLPDFWLPQVKMWAEVKPNNFEKHEYNLVFELSKETGYPCLKLIGEPDFKPYASVTVKEGLDESGRLIHDDIDMLYCLIAEYLPEGNFFYCHSYDQAIDDYGEDYKKAIYAARSERFD